MVRKERWLLVGLLLVVVLALTGCFNNSRKNIDNQKIIAAFKADLSGLLAETSGGSQISPGPNISIVQKSVTVTYTNLKFTSDLANIIINGNTATGTGTFSFSGTYNCAGTFLGFNIDYHKDFSASGSGTVHFVKVDGEWKVDAIESILLKCDNSDGEAPDIAPIQYTPSNDIAAGENITLSTTVTSALSSPGATHLGFLVVTRGFIAFVNHNVQVVGNITPYDYSTVIQTNDLNYKGNHYGAIVAYQLVENPDPDEPATQYAIYFSLQIGMFKIH